MKMHTDQCKLGSSDFVGDWFLSRQITDFGPGPDGHVMGLANIDDRGQGRLHYQEQGMLRLGAFSVMAVARAYIWQFDGSQVDVSFADGAQFHRFVAAGNVAGTDHNCGADLYSVRYDFRAWPNWQTVWRVRGRHKDYRSVCDYSK